MHLVSKTQDSCVDEKTYFAFTTQPNTLKGRLRHVRVAQPKICFNCGNRGFDSPRGQKICSLPRVVPGFPLLRLTPSGLFMVQLALKFTLQG